MDKSINLQTRAKQTEPSPECLQNEEKEKEGKEKGNARVPDKKGKKREREQISIGNERYFV